MTFHQFSDIIVNDYARNDEEDEYFVHISFEHHAADVDRFGKMIPHYISDITVYDENDDKELSSLYWVKEQIENICWNYLSSWNECSEGYEE